MSILARSTARAFVTFAGAHFLEKFTIFCRRAFAVGRVGAGFGQGATADANLVWRLIVNVGLARRRSGAAPIGTSARNNPRHNAPRRPRETQPAYVLDDRIDVGGVFFGGVGVVEAQVTGAANSSANRNLSRSIWRGRCAESRLAPAEARGNRAVPATAGVVSSMI